MKQQRQSKRIWYLGLAGLLVAALFSIATTGTVRAEPKCAILAQGAVACPDGLATGSSDCYYYDPGDPRAGEEKFPGWQKAGCGSELFKNAATPTPSIKGKPDPALKCTGGTCGIVDRLNVFVNALAALVGIVVVISIVIGGIQYGASADDPQKVSAAKDRITNAVIALLAFLLLYAFLQWLVPGGFL